MGQVQRREQQDIELWELYEEEERTAERTGTRRSGRNGYGRESRRSGGYERKEESRRAAGHGNRSGRNGNRSAGRYGNDGEQSRERRSANEGRRAQGRTGSGNIRLYEMEGNRRPSNGKRQQENPSRQRRPARAAGASQINYIQPYPAQRTRRAEPESVYRGNARPVQSIRRRRARRRREFLCKAVIVLFAVACLAMIYMITGRIYQMVHRNTEEKPLPVMTEQSFDDMEIADEGIAPPEIIQDFLEINEFSRPGDKLDTINSIFVHYTANPGTSAAQNRSYFANLAETHERSASAHLIIGYEGELIQCIPFDEQAYAVMTRNEDSLSIECCYLSDDGSFTQETYDTLIHTLAWLIDKYDLTTADILRHYDCGGKLCPLYYAENEGAWDRLRQDVEMYLAQSGQ